MIADLPRRCPNWDFARRWAANGGTAYVSLFEVGVQYPDNAYFDYCQETGMECHEDEIETIVSSLPCYHMLRFKPDF